MSRFLPEFDEFKHKRDYKGRFAKKFNADDLVHIFSNRELAAGKDPSRVGIVTKKYDDGSLDVRIINSTKPDEINSIVRLPKNNLRHAPEVKASFRGPFKEDVEAWKSFDPEMFVKAGNTDLARHAGYLKGMDDTEVKALESRADKAQSAKIADIEKNLQTYLDNIAPGFVIPSDAKGRSDLISQVFSYESMKTLMPDEVADLSIEVDPTRSDSELDVENNKITTSPSATGLDTAILRYLDGRLGFDGRPASESDEFKRLVNELRKNPKTADKARSYSRKELWDEVTRGMLNSSLDLAYKFLWDSVIQNWFMSYFTWLLHSQQRVKRPKKNR